MAAASDAILEATGVSAADILARCAQVRAGRVTGTSLAIRAADTALAVPPGPAAWRLLDFADYPDVEFLHVVHRALLRREPYPEEMERRVAGLRAGRTRMGIVVRLALSAEGRRVHEPRVTGVALRTLVITGSLIQRAIYTPPGRAARYTIRLSWRVARVAVQVARGTWRLVCAVPVLGGVLESVSLLPRLGRLRREVEQLKRETHHLHHELIRLRQERS